MRKITSYEPDITLSSAIIATIGLILSLIIDEYTVFFVVLGLASLIAGFRILKIEETEGGNK